MGDPLGRLASLVVDLVETFGYAGIAVLIALESVVPPLPSEGVLPLAGFLCGQGRLWFPGVVLAATAGSVAGALVLYWGSRRLGPERTRGLFTRYGRYVLLGEADLDRSLAWFARHGRAVVFFGRLVPMVRSFVSIPAGLDRMPLGPFLLYTAAGSALWNALLVGVGWAAGERWQDVGRYVGWLGYLALAVLVIFAVRFFWRRRRTARRGAMDPRGSA